MSKPDAPKLEYETPIARPTELTLHAAIRAFGLLVLLAGLTTWFMAYAGVDDWRQIALGITITGFGITWWMLGTILRAIERRR